MFYLLYIKLSWKWDLISWREFSGILTELLLVPIFHYIGLPAVLQMSKKIVLAPAVIFGTLFTFEYLLVPSTYYDEYDGTASEFITTPSKW